MSAFAGFVQGVFQGMDWREARDDRKRQREWDKEDRDWTKTTRARQSTVWSQDDEDRQAKLDKESREGQERQREDALAERERGLLGDIFGGGEQRLPSEQGISIAPAAEPEQQSEAAPAPSRPRVSISMADLGVSQSADQRTGAALMQDRLERDIAAQGQEQASAQPQTSTAPVQTAQAEPDPALVAEGGRIAGIQPYVPGEAYPTRNPETGQQEAPQAAPRRGLSLLGSPAYASTMPEDGPGQTEGTPYVGAGLTPRDQRQAGRRMNPEAVDRSNRALSLFPNSQDFDTPEEAAAKAEAEKEREARVAQPRAQTNVARDNANARAQAIIAGETPAPSAPPPPDAAPAMDQQPAQPAQPAPTPRPPVAQPNARNQGQGPTRAAALRIGGAEDVQSGQSVAKATSTIEGAIRDATASEGVSIAEAARGDTTPAENRRIARQAGKGIGNALNTDAVAQLEQLYVQQGEFKKAEALRSWSNQSQTQTGFAKWGEAMTYYQLGDDEAFLEAIEDLYNMKGYYDDGLTVDKGATEFTRNDNGEIVGARIVFKDNATGRSFAQNIEGPRDVVGLAVLGALSPDQVFERMMNEVHGRDEARGESAPEQLSDSDWRGYIKDAISSFEAEGRSGSNPLSDSQPPTQEEIIQRARDLAAARTGGARGADVPVYAD